MIGLVEGDVDALDGLVVLAGELWQLTWETSLTAQSKTEAWSCKSVLLLPVAKENIG